MIKNSLLLTLFTLPFFAQAEINFTFIVNSQTISEWTTPIDAHEYPAVSVVPVDEKINLQFKVESPLFTEDKVELAVNLHIISDDGLEVLLYSGNIQAEWEAPTLINIVDEPEEKVSLVINCKRD